MEMMRGEHSECYLDVLPVPNTGHDENLLAECRFQPIMANIQIFVVLDFEREILP